VSKEIDDVEPQGHRLQIVGKQKLAGDADIDLGVGRNGADISIAVAQPLPAIMSTENRMPHHDPGAVTAAIDDANNSSVRAGRPQN
jgi:hypothetical protein